MLRKLMIRTWAGPLPEWTPQFLEHVKKLAQFGWDFKVINYPDQHALANFRTRFYRTFSFPVYPKPGERKISASSIQLSRSCSPDVVADYDFWGHFNLDCVYGRLDIWLPDSLLGGVDIFANDPGAVCGPLTLYRNTPKINNLFRECPNWESIFRSQEFHGFDEGEFSDQVVKAARFHDLTFLSANWHSHDKMPIPKDPVPRLEIDRHGRLIECGSSEILMFHFNESRKWPIAA